jgi:hypothetical protein
MGFISSGYNCTYMTLVSELVWIGLKTVVVSCIVSLHNGTNDGMPAAKMDAKMKA